MVTIVDYGVGNLASIQNMLKKIGARSVISSNNDVILSSDKLILPGIGAFDTCAQKLKESGLLSILNKKVLEDKTPVLGVCVGMQLLLEKSEEGLLPGLGWIKGRVIKFDERKSPHGLKFPHMGWTNVVSNKPSRLFNSMFDEPRFYFVHSYHAELTDSSDAFLQATYGYDFVAAVERENIVGVQFHPEKSHKFGMKLFDNFVNYY